MPKVKIPKIPQVPNGYNPKPVRIPGVDMPTYVYEAETPLLATESEEAAVIAADAEISIPLITGAIILLGLLYAAKYILVPLLKLIKVPGTNFFSDFVNKVLGIITNPIKDFFRVIMAKIAEGIEAHAEPVTRTLEAGAWVLHDLSVELANFAATASLATAIITAEIIPREILKETKPLKLRVGRIETQLRGYDAVARQFGYANARVMFKAWAPIIGEIRRAEDYVHSQGHRTLAGALSTYETSTKRVRVYEETVRKLKFYDVPAWIRAITTTTTRTIPETIKKLALRVGKVENLLKFNKQGIPTLLALMTPAAIASWFKPAIPGVCTQVGDCAAGNLIGNNLWKYFKDLLGLLLTFAIGDIALGDLCGIVGLIQGAFSEIEPALRGLVVVENGLASVGCGSEGQRLPPPLY